MSILSTGSGCRWRCIQQDWAAVTAWENSSLTEIQLHSIHKFFLPAIEGITIRAWKHLDLNEWTSAVLDHAWQRFNKKLAQRYRRTSQILISVSLDLLKVDDSFLKVEQLLLLTLHEMYLPSRLRDWQTVAVLHVWSLYMPAHLTVYYWCLSVCLSVCERVCVYVYVYVCACVMV